MERGSGAVPGPGPGSRDQVRAGAFALWFDERVEAQTIPWRWGSLSVHRRFPSSSDVNFVRLDDPAAADVAASVPAEVERALRDAGIGTRRVVVEDARLAERLAPSFERNGWSVDRYLLMVHRRPADVPVEGRPTVSEVTLDRFLVFREMLLAELGEPRVLDRDLADAVDRSIGTRCFVAMMEGIPVSGCVLWCHGADAQIDTVETLPSVRGRGAATSAVAAAIDASRATGATWIHLYTPADGGPVSLYERLGFEVVGGVVEFVPTEDVGDTTSAPTRR